MSSHDFYAAFPGKTVSDTLHELLKRHVMRAKHFPPPSPATHVRTPVLLIFSRGDRAGDGRKLAEQAIASLPYWDKNSGDAIDIVLAAWDDKNEFSVSNFIRFRKEVEERSKWRFSGEVDMLLLNFVVCPLSNEGYFDFSEVIELPVEAMLREKLIGSIDGLVEEIVSAADKVLLHPAAQGDSPVWMISDAIATRWAPSAFWEAILGTFLQGHLDKYKKLSKIAVRDLSSADPVRFWVSGGTAGRS